MLAKQVVEVKQGIWIDKQWLRSAGLKNHLQVIIGKGEIRPTSASDENKVNYTRGWNIFQTLEDDAQAGKLQNAAVEHNRYLYEKNK